MNPVTSYEIFKMLIFGPLGGRFRILGHDSGPGPLMTKIFGPGESYHIVGLGRVHILNLRFFWKMNLCWLRRGES